MGDYIIELKNISKCYEGDTAAVDNVSLSIAKGEFVTLLGPSGCGKTTILRMIGGFELPTSGQILLGGKDISKLPPNERPINTVFQKYALFPYLNIYDNIAFGLKLKKLPKDVIDEKVRHVLDVVDLEGFERRRVVSSSVWRLHVRSSTSRRSCFWMNRLAHWITKCAKRCSWS